MKFTALASLAAVLVASVSASPIPAEEAAIVERAVSATCPAYTIINTRGTGEIQGQSAGFRTMNSRITSQLSGSTIYNTVYSAGFSQVSTAGTRDIINKVTSTLARDPNHCFILQGYSQGAAATTNALQSLTGASFDAVKGVFLIGNPQHKAGLACNVDTNGGTTTRNVNGLSVFQGSIPSNWVSKTLDVCNFVSASIHRRRDSLTSRVTEFATPSTASASTLSTLPTLPAPAPRTRVPPLPSTDFRHR